MRTNTQHLINVAKTISIQSPITCAEENLTAKHKVHVHFSQHFKLI